MSQLNRIGVLSIFLPKVLVDYNEASTISHQIKAPPKKKMIPCGWIPKSLLTILESKGLKEQKKPGSAQLFLIIRQKRKNSETVKK